MADLYDKIGTDNDLKRVKDAQSIGMYPYFRALSEDVTARHPIPDGAENDVVVTLCESLCAP